jgi:hypothetical protein
LRTVTHVRLDADGVRPAAGSNVETAAQQLVVGLMREARLIAPASNPILTRAEILEAWRALRAVVGDDRVPTDPESKQIVAVARAFVHDEPRRAGDQPRLPLGHDDEPHADLISYDHDYRYRAMRHALSVVAQMPKDDVVEVLPTLVHLVQDRDEGVFGLLFQSGVTFTVRLRHSNREKLRKATERLVDVLSPRAGSEVNDLVKDLPAVKRVDRRFAVEFEPIEMKTPAGELAQVGDVIAVRSQAGLFRHIALLPPQRYLLYLTVCLLAADLALKTRLVGDVVLRDLSMRDWWADNFARLGTGAFGAYLVAVFLRFAELRQRLRGVRPMFVRWRSTRGRRRIYGAFVYWRTD